MRRRAGADTASPHPWTCSYTECVFCEIALVGGRTKADWQPCLLHAFSGQACILCIDDKTLEPGCCQAVLTDISRMAACTVSRKCMHK